MRLSRREVVAGLLAAAATTATACTTIPRHRAESFPLRVPIDAFGDGDFVIVESAELPVPILLTRLDDAFVAVRMQCTHKGCPLSLSRAKLVCPCHGGEFTSDGKVLRGPPDVDLQRYATRREADVVVIEL